MSLQNKCHVQIAVLLIMFVLLDSALGAASMNMTAVNDLQAAGDDNLLIGNDCNAGPCNRTPYIRHLWYAHAILMSISFIILIPSAIIASLLKKFLPVNIGYKIHLLFNGTALVFILCGFGIAVYIVSTYMLLPTCC